MGHFFATAEDLLPIFQGIESRLQIQYILNGHHDSKDIESWWHGQDLPTLGQPSPTDSAVNCPSYLVTVRDSEVNLRELNAPFGRRRWVVDQLVNPDSTVIWLGGLYGTNILLSGRFATVSKTPIALKLQRAFDSAIRKSFSRINAYYVGACAESLLDSGVRLT